LEQEQASKQNIEAQLTSLEKDRIDLEIEIDEMKRVRSIHEELRQEITFVSSIPAQVTFLLWLDFCSFETNHKNMSLFLFAFMFSAILYSMRDLCVLCLFDCLSHLNKVQVAFCFVHY